jgi:hypothetical protein
MPCERSDFSAIEFLFLGRKKLGQPQPASNLVSDSKSAALQQIHI